MDLLHLKYFQTVAQENHLTRAAQKLYIAQPALSAAIARLEKDMCVQLFDRVGRQIILNDYGKILLDHVNEMLGSWDAACNTIAQRQRENSRQIKLAVTGINFPQELTLAFKKANPGINVKQSIIMSDQIVPALVKDKYDFVISTIPVEEDGILSHLVRRERLVIMMNRAHPLAVRDSIALGELHDNPFISLPEGFAFRSFTDSVCRDAGFEQNVVYECFPSQFSDVVGQNVGVAFTRQQPSAKMPQDPAVVFVRLSPPCLRTVSILWEESRVFPESSQLFYDFVLHYDDPDDSAPDL